MLFKLLLFSLLFFFTASVVRMFRSITRRQGGSQKVPTKEKRPAVSPDEIVDVDFEDCGSSKDETKERF